MEFTGRVIEVYFNPDSGKFNLVLEVDNRQALINEYDEIQNYNKLDVTIKKHSEKRSLDANAYAWALLHKLALKRGRTAEAIYRDYIRNFGICEIVPIRHDAIKRWESIWKSKGYGWVTEDMGECKHTKGYHNIKCFYGTSTYSTLEMSHFIDVIVQDCKEQGIPTDTPEQIERIKAAWQNG